MTGRQKIYTSADVARWRALYEQAFTLEEIGQRFGVSVGTISLRLRAVGVLMRDGRKPSKSASVRFERKWTPEPNTGCWLWLGGTQKAGYGFFKYAGEVTAHRSAWRLYRGDIPYGLHVLHRCDVRQCVNPEHLFLGTQSDNMKDMAAKGRAQRFNSFKTHCPQGHPYDSENTHWLPKGGRRCRACARVKAALFRQEHIERYRAYDKAKYWEKKGRKDGQSNRDSE